MFAVVLVGGFGTRLRPLTNDLPKPMLPIGHRPMIVGLVDRLAAAGVTDVVLALGFRPEPFAAAFPDGRHDGVRLHYAVEPEPLDTGGAIGFAAREVGVDDTFFVCNGDIVCDLDLRTLREAHQGRDATIHLTPVDDPSAFGVVEIGADRTVRRFVEKPAPGETDSDLINAGTYVFEPSVLDLIESGRRVSVERDVFPQLAEQGRLGAVPTDDYWIDAGRPELYLRANLDLINGVRTHAVDPIAAGADVHAGAVVAEALVSDRVVVGDGATVRSSLLLPGADIGAGADVVSSIVGGSVGIGATVIDSVVAGGWVVAAGATVHGERLPVPD